MSTPMVCSEARVAEPVRALAVAGVITGAMIGLLAAAAPAMAEQPILTITLGGGDKVAFDRAALDAMHGASLETHTVVTDGLRQFDGVLMRDLLAAAGLDEITPETEVIARALNDYEIIIPGEDFIRFDVLAALSMDGDELSPRDKGPIWIVYPRDAHAELQDIRYDTRWVWQLRHLEIR